MRICLVSVLSNLHLLLDIDNAWQLSKFMHLFNSNLAKEVNRLTGGSGPVFERRYTAILVSGEEEAQVRRSERVRVKAWSLFAIPRYSLAPARRSTFVRRLSR